MNFTALLNNVICYWPEQILIGDGRLSENGGFYSERLSHVWNAAENKCRNEWEELLVWAMYQELHELSKKQFQKEETIIELRDLSKRLLEQTFLEALQEEGYESMLKEYHANN